VTALRTALIRRASSKGFTRKSNAPARIASTARLIEPFAVMTMTRASGRPARSSSSRVMPSPSGSCRSSSTSGKRSRASSARASARVEAIVTGWPARPSTLS
jgi:hypothetical protein